MLIGSDRGIFFFIRRAAFGRSKRFMLFHLNVKENRHAAWNNKRILSFKYILICCNLKNVSLHSRCIRGLGKSEKKRGAEGGVGGLPLTASHTPFPFFSQAPASSPPQSCACYAG